MTSSPPLFLFHSGANALLAPHPDDPTKHVAFPLNLLRQTGWIVDDISMRRLPKPWLPALALAAAARKT